jgi:hypothetical protein
MLRPQAMTTSPARAGSSPSTIQPPPRGRVVGDPSSLTEDGWPAAAPVRILSFRLTPATPFDQMVKS